MTGLFQQKQRELLVAVSRVEELSDQLEALRSNRLEHPLPLPPPHHYTSTAELERLYKELQVRSLGFCSSVDDVDQERLVNTEHEPPGGLSNISFLVFHCSSAEEQAEPGSEQQAAAAQRQPQQEEPGGRSDGATAGRAPTATLEEESRPAAEGEPASE